MMNILEINLTGEKCNILNNIQNDFKYFQISENYKNFNNLEIDEIFKKLHDQSFKPNHCLIIIKSSFIDHNYSKSKTWFQKLKDKLMGPDPDYEDECNEEIRYNQLIKIINNLANKLARIHFSSLNYDWVNRITILIIYQSSGINTEDHIDSELYMSSLEYLKRECQFILRSRNYLFDNLVVITEDPKDCYFNINEIINLWAQKFKN